MDKTVRTTRSKLFYFLAVASSVAGLVVTLLALLYFQLPRGVGIVISLAVPCLLGGILGFWRPGSARLLALCVSSAFLGYFGLVFLALSFNSERDWIAALLSVGALASGWIGARVFGSGNRP